MKIRTEYLCYRRKKSNVTTIRLSAANHLTKIEDIRRRTRLSVQLDFFMAFACTIGSHRRLCASDEYVMWLLGGCDGETAMSEVVVVCKGCGVKPCFSTELNRRVAVRAASKQCRISAPRGATVNSWKGNRFPAISSTCLREFGWLVLITAISGRWKISTISKVKNTPITNRRAYLDRYMQLSMPQKW